MGALASVQGFPICYFTHAQLHANVSYMDALDEIKNMLIQAMKTYCFERNGALLDLFVVVIIIFLKHSSAPHLACNNWSCAERSILTLFSTIPLCIFRKNMADAQFKRLDRPVGLNWLHAKRQMLLGRHLMPVDLNWLPRRR